MINPARIMAPVPADRSVASRDPYGSFLRPLSSRRECVDRWQTYKGDALIWIMGANKFRWEKTWPIPDTRYAKLYLRANRAARLSRRRGEVRPATIRRPGTATSATAR